MVFPVLTYFSYMASFAKKEVSTRPGPPTASPRRPTPVSVNPLPADGVAFPLSHRSTTPSS